MNAGHVRHHADPGEFGNVAGAVLRHTLSLQCGVDAVLIKTSWVLVRFGIVRICYLRVCSLPEFALLGV